MRNWFDEMKDEIMRLQSEISDAKNDIQAGIIIDRFLNRLHSRLNDFEDSLRNKVNLLEKQ